MKHTAFKVLSRVSIGRSNRDFDLHPYLPRSVARVNTVPARTRIRLFESGWHFTIRPEVHWREGGGLYVAETKGRVLMENGDKLTASSVASSSASP